MRSRTLVVGEGKFAQQLADVGSAVLLDTTDYEAAINMLAWYRPDSLVLAPGWAEITPAFPFQAVIDAGATGAIKATAIALAARGAGIPLVVTSNVSVFVGGWEVATDKDEPNPITEYGVTLWWMENAIRRVNRHVTIARVGHLIGSGRDNWATRVIERDLHVKKGQDPFVAVPDVGLNSPTCSNCAAKVIMDHVRHDPDLPPVAHVAPEDGPISWYDFASLVGLAKKGGREDVFGPKMRGLLPSEGWSTGTILKQASHLLLEHPEYVLPPTDTGTG